MSDAADREELGPIATKVLYEDDEIRIWDQRLEPGEKTAAHRHDNDYALIDVRGEAVGVEPVVGYPDSHVPHYLEIPAGRGQVHYVPKGSVEKATNAGPSAYRSILVEFKK